MSDDFDEAQRREDLHRHLGIDAARRQAAATLHGEGADDCEGCGEPIPKARKQILPGATRCAQCQSLFERHVR